MRAICAHDSLRQSVRFCIKIKAESTNQTRSSEPKIRTVLPKRFGSTPVGRSCVGRSCSNHYSDSRRRSALSAFRMINHRLRNNVASLIVAAFHIKRFAKARKSIPPHRLLIATKVVGIRETPPCNSAPIPSVTQSHCKNSGTTGNKILSEQIATESASELQSGECALAIAASSIDLPFCPGLRKRTFPVVAIRTCPC